MKLEENQRLYTKQLDGTIAVWFVFSQRGDDFCVSPRRNAKRRDYRKYFTIADIGKTIFLTRKEAREAV